MHKKEHLNEIEMLRVVACVSIILFHAIHLEVGKEYNGEGLIEFVLLTISGLLAFGTPVFVSISAIVLAYSYPDNIPSHYYGKRLKFILIPFISMGIIYAISSNAGTVSRIPAAIMFNMLGNYHGWFVLVIFQFYILHHLFTKYLSRIPPTLMLLSAFAVNMAYLGFFNFVHPPGDNIYFQHLWERWYWYPFSAWLFYYTLAYYIGKNYHEVILFIHKYLIWILIGLPLTVVLIIMDNIYLELPYGSKRVDMILFTVLSIFILLFVCHKFKNIPVLFDVISRYSFGIYLLHWAGLFLAKKAFIWFGIDFGYFNIILWFFISIVSSILVIHLLNKFPFGKYIVGRVKQKKNQLVPGSKKEEHEYKANFSLYN